MKIKKQTEYKIVSYTFVTLTVASYIWMLWSVGSWIFKAIFL